MLFLRLLATAVLAAALGGASAGPLPRLVAQDGRHALMVDGQPFLILGGQVHNSSNSAAGLAQAWPALRDAQANTALVPVAWEQVEAVPGRFDFSFVDLLLKQARQRQMRLVLLWFGTWKNTSPQYAPAWVRLDPQRYPPMRDAQGQPSYCLSPFGEQTLAADRRAFTALMRHLKRVDGTRHTVLMVQVENEVGTWGLARDHGERAQAAFQAPVPAEVLRLQPPRSGATSGNWPAVYGEYAEQYFHSWAMARYLGEVARAGREVYDLPVYVNNALRDAKEEPPAPWSGQFASGGPTHDVLGIYRAAAPRVDAVGPDIYAPESDSVEAVIRRFKRPDNPLWVPEIGNAAAYARHLYAILGAGAIGVTPFGIDYADYANYPLGSTYTDRRMVEPFGRIFAAWRPMQRLWARWAFEGRTQGVAEPDDRQPRTLTLRGWQVKASWREFQFGEKDWPNLKDRVPEGTEQPDGGVAIAQTGDDEFIVIGQRTRLRFGPLPGAAGMMLHAEEGRFDERGRWQTLRRWNGDQVDWGLNLPARPTVLRVRMARPITAGTP